MIVGTAGHIDHGKTSLLKALTGTDADRLPEEKARSITVDLGFAYQHFGDRQSISFLDVPGHEKLIHNMLAGALGIDFVILVVAADDGVMPQTREHLAVIDLLGLRRGVVALTKTDRVTPARMVEAQAEIEQVLVGTTLEGAPIFPLSAVTNEGVAALSQHLADAASTTAQRKSHGHFRLAVDRCFTLSGIGLVVTGTVYSGEVNVGDTLLHSPTGTEVRVRGIRAENREAERATAGQRCALNLTGRKIEKDQIKRGDWILQAEAHAPTSRMDVRLKLLASETRPLKHWTPVHIHIAAAERTGRIGLLQDAPIAPGESALAQIILDAPLGAVFGDRFVIRDQSALRTIGGGTIIDPFPPQRGARTPERLSLLSAMDEANPTSALIALLNASTNGTDLNHFCRARNLTFKETGPLYSAAGVVEVASGPAKFGLSADNWDKLQSEVLEHLAEYQRAHQDSPGATAHELMRLFKDPRRRIIAREAVARLVTTGALQRYGQLLHLPGHQIKLNDGEEALWLQIEEALSQAGFDQPRVTRLAEILELQVEALQPVLEKLGRVGRLRRISKAYFMLPGIVAKLADEAKTSADTHLEKLLTVGKFREATNVSRHMVMPLMEFFDKIGYTRRLKDGRQIRNEWIG